MNSSRLSFGWFALLGALLAGGAFAGDAVRIPAGVFRPITRTQSEPALVEVAEFELDALPVTNGEFLEFVRAHPRWRRSRAGGLFADESYLRHWAGDLELGPSAPPDAPVVNVSWFAARAYARARERRLPTLAEWELAAAAGYTTPVGRDEEAFNRDLYAWLGSPTPEVLPSVASARPNLHGARGLHGLVWEWVDDFNTAMVTGESRGDTDRDQNLFCGGASATASDTSDYAAFMRQALRASLTAKQGTSSLGFRCAADPRSDGAGISSSIP
jgi:sulfatase modifying factor 1